MDSKATKGLSRRDAIKLLGAAAGSTLLANLPSKWTTPRITAGVLPAHAQSSAYSLTCWLELDGPSIETGADIIPNPGKVVTLRLVLVLDGVQAPPFGLDSTHDTDLGGGVGTGWTYTPTHAAPQFVTATWSFNDPLDGTGTCQRPPLQLPTA
jgi:hypothetical protein